MGKRPPIPPDIERGSPPPPARPQFRPPIPVPWFAWLVPVILTANIITFATTMYLNDCPARSDECLLFDILGRLSFQPIKENMLLGPSIPTLRKLGALERKLVEEVRIGALYVISGLGGSLMSCLTDSRGERVSVGASGALFGLLGAMLSELITNWTIYENKCTALMTLILIIALNLSVGFLPRVDNSAHFGGFLAGFFLGFVLLLRPQYGYVNPKYIPAGYDMKHKKPKHKCYQHVLKFTSLAILLAGFIAAYAKLLREHTVETVPLREFN